jgi:cyclohexanecarboxylate-CoA ligase
MGSDEQRRDDEVTYVDGVIRVDALDQLIAARAAATPDAEMACESGGRRITYAEFETRVAEVAGGLQQLDVEPGTIVSWTLPTSIDALVLSAALRLLGAVQNPIIPNYRQSEFLFCVGQVQASLLVVPGVWRGFDYAAMANEVHTQTGVTVVDTTNGLPSGPPLRVAATRAPDATNWVFYTSGTTSDPKGAKHRDAGLIGVADGIAERYDTRFGDRSAIVFPYTHIGGIVWLYITLRHGVTLLFDEAFDPVRTTEFLVRERVTHAGSGTPFHMAYLAAQRAHPDQPLFSNLKNCPGGGAPKPPELHYAVKRELGGSGIASGWGLTEAPILTTARHSDPDEKLANTEGFPLPGVVMRVVKSDGSVAAAGEAGELRAKGPQVMVGYVDSRLDAPAFDEQGYFRTGDLGVIDADGYVTITGRLKDVIIRNGENISAKEIEDLLFTHPLIADVAVIGLPDPRVGERACAVVVPVDGNDPPTFVSMQQFLRDKAIRVHAIPEQLEIVTDLPRNASGKILKNQLREQFVGSSGNRAR